MFFSAALTFSYVIPDSPRESSLTKSLAEKVLGFFMLTNRYDSRIREGRHLKKGRGGSLAVSPNPCTAWTAWTIGAKWLVNHKNTKAPRAPGDLVVLW